MPCLRTRPAAPLCPRALGQLLARVPGPRMLQCPVPTGQGAACANTGGLCQHAVCIPRRTPDLWPGTAWCYGRPSWLLPPLCHLPALPLQLPVDHCQEGEEEGPKNHQGDTVGDTELGLASPCVGGSEWCLGWGRALAGGLSPDMGLLTPCHWSCSPGLSPKRAGVLPGTLSVQGLP